MTAARHVGALHITAMSSRIHHAGAVMLTHHPAPTVDAVLNVHAIAINGPNRSIRANVRVSSALQTDVPGAGGVTEVASTCRRVSVTCRCAMTRSSISVARGRATTRRNFGF